LLSQPIEPNAQLFVDGIYISYAMHYFSLDTANDANGELVTL